MNEEVEILTANAENIERLGFFCYKSKSKTSGYKKKLAWLRQRFTEGMRIKILYENSRSKAFIEYIPGEYAWRAVDAKNYLFVHCLWVVGRAKGKGYGSRLLDECIQDARAEGFDGVAMLTSSGNWLAGSDLLLKHGFEVVAQAPPSFELLALGFRQAAFPTLPHDWDDRLQKFGRDMTVIYTDQCPYIDRLVQAVFNAGRELGVEVHAVEFHDCEQVQRNAPSAYGVYSVIYRGALMSYHPIGKQDLIKRLKTCFE
ncbi:MAG TPA: GNAT family N-acetyltransferase [Anaerolineae bacterium]|nr:GNAT family N-acetyltransferase [Anaerolineae bacterium]